MWLLPPPTSAARETLTADLAAATIYLIPVNWVLGTTLLWIYAVTAVVAVSLSRLGVPERLFLALAGTLCAALLMAIPGGVPGDRVFASLYNLSVIVSIIMFVRAGQMVAASGDLADRIYHAGFRCFVVYALTVAAGAVILSAERHELVEFPTLLLGRLGQLPGILEFYSTAQFAALDWINGSPHIRIIGFGIYATEGACLFALIALLAAVHLGRRKGLLALIAIELVTLPVLVVMASRTTFLAYLLSMSMLLLFAGRRLVMPVTIFLPLLVVGASVMALHPDETIGRLADAVASARAGSTDGRLESYATAIGMVLEGNAFTGLGVKPRDDTMMSIPIGSHSSVISMFTKGGLLSLTALLLVYGAYVMRLAGTAAALLRGSPSHLERRLEIIYLGRAVVVILLWWLTEDLDAPAQHAALAGLVLGMFWAATVARSPAANTVSGYEAFGQPRARWARRLTQP